MKRHDSLHDLSRDHYHALRQSQEIRRAVEGHEQGRPVQEVAEEFCRFWEEDAAAHFREEEEVILPLYARHGAPCDDPGVRRMLDDHAWFRDVMVDLAARVEQGDGYEELLVEAGDRLHDHARFEERELFPRIEEALEEEELAELGRRSLAFRETWRSPDAIGPYEGESCEVDEVD